MVESESIEGPITFYIYTEHYGVHSITDRSNSFHFVVSLTNIDNNETMMYIITPSDINNRVNISIDVLPGLYQLSAKSTNLYGTSQFSREPMTVRVLASELL